MEPTLEEKLKAVAEFMGLDIVFMHGYFRMSHNGITYEPHNNYNQLMKAWRKWKTLVKPNDLRNGYVFENHTSIIGAAILEQPIENAFNELVYAIAWYNLIKK